ncbi:MAG TPA: CHAT domain-containing protein, partial [Polyangiaceae bacterium]
ARLRESLELTHPELIDPGGAIRLERLHTAPSGSRRDIVEVAGGWLRKIYTLAAGGVKDAIIQEALGQVESQSELGVSWAGTKALMWAIEKRLDREPGLYHWSGTGRKQNDLCPVDIANTTLVDPKCQRMLIFVHGTASSTHGSFGDLCEGEPGLWSALKREYQGGVYAFEHRTLSESPIENAIQLIERLPVGARISLVSHSRGGLVADLLCLKDFDACIEHYAYTLEGTGDANPNEAKRVKQELSVVYAEQREQLKRLSKALSSRAIVVERYVRAASPANGTKLASGNLDLFLSGLLTLVGQVPYLFGSPVYAAFKRVVIEIAKNRTNPHLVPGIEAMLPDSPMAVLLREAPVRDGVSMALIAGDIEGGNLFQRLGLLLTDSLIFSREDNDLVVNTTAMLAGVARKLEARVMFDRSAKVSHFRYFTNFETRTALREWLTDLEPTKLNAFRALPADSAEYVAALVEATRGTAEDSERPIVVVLPGVMGSHLRRGDKDRVWFDPLDLATGGLMKIAWPEACEADELFAWFYGRACNYLSTTHRVVTFAYDWRQPLDVLASRLASLLEKLLENPAQPIRLLAHSMGGLVVRACIHRHRALMDRVMQRNGARLVMLGTPNQGAYSMVENLLGKGDTVRALARLDLANPLQKLLDVIAGFPGALQLLPKPGFKDDFQGEPAGGEAFELQSSDLWLTLKKHSKDFWFGDGITGVPSQSTLNAASLLWKWDGLGRPAIPNQYKDQCVYVNGLARNTPCGVRDETSRNGRIKMVGTSRGDGTVTWASGRIDGIGSYYYMPAPHGELLSSEAHFAALSELLTAGSTKRLAQQPPALRSVEETVPIVYDAGPPSLESLDAIQRGFMAGTLDQQVPPQPGQRLKVCVKAMDLRFLAQPILVGHYENDPIAGPEALIDHELLGGELRVRHSLGLYAGPRGTAVVVLRIPNEFERQRHSLRGAVVTGLGPYDGALSVSELTDAVRTGALRYLMQVVDLFGNGECDVTLAALLLGYNSSASLSVAASVEAVVRGVLEANARFRETTRRNVRISQLDLVELYLDTAITAVYALGALSTKLSAQADSLGVKLDCHDELFEGEGARHRLFDSSDAKYWPRLIVTDANRTDDDCSPQPNAAPTSGTTEFDRDSDRRGPKDGSRAPTADALRFLYVGQRARAESVKQQRQPELVERIVRDQIRSGVWQEDLGRMLFQLLIPPEFKDAARQLERLVLVLDTYTANLPWELMLGDDPTREGEHQPLALRAAVVRQLASHDFRQQVRHGSERQALVIGNPSLSGAIDAFPSVKEKLKNGIVALPDAEAEAEAVVGVLRAFGYDVKPVIGEDQTATNVLSALYQKPWRILHISAHGVFGLRHRDGKLRSGVLLSDGLLITASEIQAMELVPELVVLSCCHLGTLDIGRDGDKFAASVARELIDIGVRCVIVAGWAVSDNSARLFGETFYAELLLQRQSFGDAVFSARKAVWDAQPGDITWGAFQAYGDPGWLAEPRANSRNAQSGTNRFASIHELVDELGQLRVTLSRNRDYQTEAEIQAQMALVSSLLRERCPAAWQQLPGLQSA